AAEAQTCGFKTNDDRIQVCMCACRSDRALDRSGEFRTAFGRADMVARPTGPNPDHTALGVANQSGRAGLPTIDAQKHLRAGRPRACATAQRSPPTPPVVAGGAFRYLSYHAR